MKLFSFLVVLGAVVATIFADLTFVDEVRQNFDAEVNEQIGLQVQYELVASYLYQSYASFLGRADVALPGFQKFFSEASKEEREHAQKLIDYVNLRGGHVQYDSIDLGKACTFISSGGILTSPRIHPCICEKVWTKSSRECSTSLENQFGKQAMEDALSLERVVNQKLLDLHKKADEKGDAHLTNFLEGEFLEEQVNSIREFAGHVTRLRSFTTNYALGEYLYDQKLQ